MKILKIIIFVIALTVCAFILYFAVIRNNRDTKLIKQGNLLIYRIEDYKLKTGRVPNSLKEIGINESQSLELFYLKRDSMNYIIWYGTSLGESNTYHSDSR